MAYIYGLLSLLAFIASGNLFILGINWLEQGYGLNPWIAFPLCLLFMVIGFSAGVQSISILDPVED